MVLGYKEGSLGMVYLWFIRKESGTDRGGERLCHDMLSKESVSKCERVQVLVKYWEDSRLTLTALCVGQALGNSHVLR